MYEFEQFLSFLRSVAEFGTFILLCYTAWTMREVKHATNSLLDRRVEAAEQVGHGKAMEEIRQENKLEGKGEMG